MYNSGFEAYLTAVGHKSHQVPALWEEGDFDLTVIGPDHLGKETNT